jgi:hypothetical protein
MIPSRDVCPAVGVYFNAGRARDVAVVQVCPPRPGRSEKHGWQGWPEKPEKPEKPGKAGEPGSAPTRGAIGGRYIRDDVTGP